MCLHMHFQLMDYEKIQTLKSIHFWLLLAAQGLLLGRLGPLLAILGRFAELLGRFWLLLATL